MLDSGSHRYSQACVALERDRSGAVPLALPTDGFPRPEAFSQLVHLKGVRVQRDLYPRANFNAALEAAALSGLECYRFRTFRNFVNHVPIALVPRSSNVVLAHIPTVLSQAADAVLALGHRLYFVVQGPLRSVGDEDDEDDDEIGFLHPLRGGGSNPGVAGSSSSGAADSRTNSQRSLAAAAPPPSPGLGRTRSGSVSVSGFLLSSGPSLSNSGGVRLAAWGSSSITDGGCGNDNGTNGNNDTLVLPDRRGSVGTSLTGTASTVSSLQSSLQSASSIKSSASSSLRSLRTLLSARHSGSSRTLRLSEPDIEFSTDPRVSEPTAGADADGGAAGGDDAVVTLAGGGRLSYDKLAINLSVFADGEDGVQAFRRELELRGWRGGGVGAEQELVTCRPVVVRQCR